MAKATIRQINTPMGGGASAVTTVTIVDTGAVNVGAPSPIGVTTPPSTEITGELVEMGTNTVYQFRQPLGEQLGITEVGAKVSFTPVADATGKMMAVSVKLVDRGVIQTIDAGGESGTLMDRSSKQMIKFIQPLALAMGLKPQAGAMKGSVVSFERVLDPATGNYVAVALNL